MLASQLHNETLRARDGATASLERSGDVETLVVRAKNGRPLFEYHANDSERCVVYAPSGDLELRADHGDIVLSAAENVRIEGKTVSHVADRLRQTIGVVEVVADRWVERLSYAYRDVEHLSQTRAGRIREIAKDTFQLLGRRTVLKAEEDMKVKGAKIHLA